MGEASNGDRTMTREERLSEILSKVTQVDQWSNYTTWRIYEDLFSPAETNVVGGHNLLDEFDGNLPDAETLGKRIRLYATQVIFKSSTAGSAAERWAIKFIGDVDWTQIAQYLKEKQP